MRNKKALFILLLGFVIIILLYIWYYNKKNNVTFELIGDKNINTEYNEEYTDLGYRAYNGFNKDISEYVTVNNPVDTNKIGEYNIEYVLNYSKTNIKLERTVTVINTKIKNFDLFLNGNETIYLPLNSEYVELNGYVINKATNEKLDNSFKITNNIDNKKIGEYKVNYEFSYYNQKKVIERKVIVYNIQIDYILKKIDSNNLNINIKLEGLDNYYQYLTIDNKEKITDKIVNTEIEKNNNKKIIIYLNDENQIEKDINIQQLNKYNCNGTIKRNGTTLSINNKANVSSYEWIINDKVEKGNDTYSIFKSITNGDVKLTLDNNDTYTLPCQITDQLIYHFVYDENNTKPYMTCSTYTSEDRKELDAKLKNSIEEAGYGTRAGVVEAARFMVGAMTHKIIYLGPKKDYLELGKYYYIGLNIGKKGAWGCTVSGWTQGIDCTNFVAWAFYQNGINMHPYSNTRSEIIDVIDKVKVGDLVYTPENKRPGECRNTTCLDHVGIIIGIDDNYLYIAEQTAWGTRVNKKDKHNLPKKGEEFSLVHFYNYKSDGNLTNMWMD